MALETPGAVEGKAYEMVKSDHGAQSNILPDLRFS